MYIESLTVDSPGHVNPVSVVELVWALTGCHAVTRHEIAAVPETLLRAKELVIADADSVWKALQLF